MTKKKLPFEIKVSHFGSITIQSEETKKYCNLDPIAHGIFLGIQERKDWLWRMKEVAADMKEFMRKGHLDHPDFPGMNLETWSKIEIDRCKELEAEIYKAEKWFRENYPVEHAKLFIKNKNPVLQLVLN